MVEREIMATTGHHPFLVEFYASFQTKENLFMVMEYLPGGDLFAMLKNVGNFEEDLTRCGNFFFKTENFFHEFSLKKQTLCS
jgi:serine/threonine protein kinase